MEPHPELPELNADVVTDDDLLVEVIEAAMDHLKVTDPWLARLCEERRFQIEMLRTVAPETAAQQLVVEEATGRYADHVVILLVRWAFEAGARSTGRSA